MEIKVVIGEEFFAKNVELGWRRDSASNLLEGERRLAFHIEGEPLSASWAEVLSSFGLGEYYGSLPEISKVSYDTFDWVEDRDYCRKRTVTKTSYPRRDFVRSLLLGAEVTLTYTGSPKKGELYMEAWFSGEPRLYTIADILLSDDGSAILEQIDY